jgi:hypothetical protein
VLTKLRRQFRLSLHHSLTTGRVTTAATGLGSQTISAISAVAQAHPDASSQQIVAAYEAFAREHAVVPMFGAEGEWHWNALT